MVHILDHTPYKEPTQPCVYTHNHTYRLTPKEIALTMNPTTTLAQRMAANDGYLHACCDPNPLPGFISTMNANAEDIINYRAIKVPGTDTPRILHVASTRLRMPGRFMEPTRHVTTTGPDAMGYARPSEPRDAYIQQLEESICSHGFSITHPAMACPIIDPDDIKIAEMINENKLLSSVRNATHGNTSSVPHPSSW